MVAIATGCCDAWWFGVAWHGTDLVATARGLNRNDALRNVTRCVSPEIETYIEENPPAFVSSVISMLGELERGEEKHKRFTLSERYVSRPLRRVLTVAAAIPIGYVSTYGDIANTAGSVARAVGRVMARNPLYPIVPCHRVVGANMALVGYGGKQDVDALAAKLLRLEAEIRGFRSERKIELADGTLTVYPVERAVEAVRQREEKQRRLKKRASDRAEAERKQLQLF